MKNSFVLYCDYMKQIELLNMEQRGVLLTAIMQYSSGQEVVEMDGMTNMAFSFIQNQLDRDKEKYERTVKSRSDAGKKGGRPKKQEEAKKANAFHDKQKKQGKAKKADNDNVDDDVDDNDIKNNNVHDADALFEDLWRLYPQKRGKGQVSEASKRRLLDIGYEQFVRAIERYKADLDKDRDWRKPQNGSTFFTSGYKDYLDGSYEPPMNAIPAKNTASKNNNNFERRNYDMDLLEEQILRTDMEGKTAIHEESND